MFTWGLYQDLDYLPQTLPGWSGFAHFQSPKISAYLGHSSSFTTPWIGRARVPSPTSGKPQDPPVEALTTVLMVDQKKEPLFLPENCRHHKYIVSGPSHHTNRQHAKRHGSCLSTCEKIYQKYPSFFFYKITLLWKGSLFIQLLIYVFRRVEL